MVDKMMLLTLTVWLYNRLLRTYPPAFRQRFAGEMAQVFCQLCKETYQQRGAGGLLRLWLAAYWDGLCSMLEQWRQRLYQKRRLQVSSIESDQQPGFQPLSVNHAWLAILPFLGFGLASLANRLIVIDKQPAFWQALLDSPFLVFNWLVMLGLGIGLYKGAPRWVYSYLGWALLFAWWWSNMSSYGYHWKGELWLLLAGVILFILLLKRSWQPLKALANGLWQDWTFLSFGLYILYSFVYMLFDENHHPRLLMLIAATTLVICLGAWGYYRLTGPLRRVLALLGGLLGATALSVFSEATWNSSAYYGLPESAQNVNLVSLIAFAILAAMMLGNALLTRWRQRKLAVMGKS